ncbi:MAG: hypothetical protein MN733_09740 [Nitrososphaera sp.]|nr:hypothetical protein [Nitrososphaera sp.]
MPYEIRMHPSVERFLRRNRRLRELWDSRKDSLALSPRFGQGIRHLRGDLACNYRLRLDVWRMLYEINDETRTVLIYRARTRDDAYDT